MKINKGGSIASKQSMNLAYIEKKKVNPFRVIVTTLIFAVAILAFLKFGVFDRYAKVNEARTAYQDEQDLYNSLLIANADYDAVVVEFNKYSFGAMTEDERAVADRGEVLNIVEKYLVPAAQIESVQLNANELAVVMSGITLEKASSLIKVMLEDELVDNISISTANTKDELTSTDEEVENVVGEAQDAKITFTITLADNTIGLVNSTTTTEETTEEEAGDNE